LCVVEMSLPNRLVDTQSKATCAWFLPLRSFEKYRDFQITKAV
jgi:hypothetical protein